jgi:hypothetical protein
MGRARVGLLAAVALAAMMAGCSSSPAVPAGVQNGPPPPTAPVGANGQPITSLCDLLTQQDFESLTGQTGKKVEPKDVTQTSATCDYGTNMRLNIQIGGSLDDATATYQKASKTDGFTAVKQGPIGGVDESVFGTAAGSGVLSLRRLKLVVTISAPGTDSEIKLVQLAALVLSRANALGT